MSEKELVTDGTGFWWAEPGYMLQPNEHQVVRPEEVKALARELTRLEAENARMLAVLTRIRDTADGMFEAGPVPAELQRIWWAANEVARNAPPRPLAAPSGDFSASPPPTDTPTAQKPAQDGCGHFPTCFVKMPEGTVCPDCLAAELVGARAALAAKTEEAEVLRIERDGARERCRLVLDQKIKIASNFRDETRRLSDCILRADNDRNALRLDCYHEVHAEAERIRGSK